MFPIRLLPILVSLAFFTGCADGPPLANNTTRYQVSEGEGLPSPEVRDVAAGGLREYAIGPLDRLTIDVFGIEGLQQRNVQADASGMVSFPIAGTIAAAGLTPVELQDEIRKRLIENHVRDPQVTVNILEVNSQIVTVEGEVGQPGLFPVVGDMTLLKSLASAQGLDERAKEDIVVFRTVGGQKYAAVYNIKAIRSGAYADPQIYGGDIVIVGESAQRRRFDNILAAMTAVLSPIVLLVR